MKMNRRIENLLTNIGLTGLEASAYVVLLREPGATAYRVSQLIGKAPANTYKALDSLLAKGAVVVDESAGSKTYVALPVREYLNSKRRDLDEQQEAIEKALSGVAVESTEQGMYRLASIEQVYERCRALIAGAEKLVLLDAFPTPMAELKRDLRAAAKRGVKVFVKPYAKTSIPGCDVLDPAPGPSQLDVWKGDWLNLVADCSQSVQAFLGRDGSGVLAAAWCRNPYLAMLDFNGMASEFILTRVMVLAHEGKDGQTIGREIGRMMGRYMEFGTFVRGIPDAWLLVEKRTAGRPKRRRK